MLGSRMSTRRSIAVSSGSLVNNYSTPVTRRRSVLQSANVKLLGEPAPAAPLTPLVLSQEPKSKKSSNILLSTLQTSLSSIAPVGSNVVNKETPKTRYADPVFSRIQRDLNSPSAAARVRANKALKSPNFRKANYGVFDVPHERQDIITEEERRSFKPKTIKDIFANCKIYVEVRTGDDNRSAGIKSRLLRDGIAVNEKLYKDTTHVIFKDGLLSTYKNAKKMNIPVTTILWIDACKAQRRLVDPEKFKISSLDRYEHPELYKRLRRQKSMQPDISKITATFVPGGVEKSFSLDDSREVTRYFGNETIAEVAGEKTDETGMELTLQNDETLSTPLAKPASGLERLKEIHRRVTTFTPHPMEQTGMSSKDDRRRTIFTPQLTQSEDCSTPEGFSANSSKTIVFNSHSRVAKASRRSVFDISMNILDLNCKAIAESKSETTDNPESLSEKKAPCPKAAMTPSAQLKYKLTQSLKPAVVRKRKLFNNDDPDNEDYKENLNKSLKEPNAKRKLESTPVDKSKKSSAAEKKFTQSVDRRKTISYFKPMKTKETSITKPKSPAKPAQVKVVCTNMLSTDKLILQAVSIADEIAVADHQFNP